MQMHWRSSCLVDTRSIWTQINIRLWWIWLVLLSRKSLAVGQAFPSYALLQSVWAQLATPPHFMFSRLLHGLGSWAVYWDECFRALLVDHSCLLNILVSWCIIRPKIVKYVKQCSVYFLSNFSFIDGCAFLKMISIFTRLHILTDKNFLCLWVTYHLLRKAHLLLLETNLSFILGLFCSKRKVPKTRILL